MEVTKTNGGTIVFRKEKDDEDDIRMAMIAECRFIPISDWWADDSFLDLFDVDDQTKYHMDIVESQKKFSAGEDVVLSPEPMTFLDYEKYDEGAILIRIFNDNCKKPISSQVSVAYQVGDVFLYPYSINPYLNKHDGTIEGVMPKLYGCLAFDKDYHPIKGCKIIVEPNAYTAMHGVLKYLGKSEDVPTTTIDVETLLLKGGYKPWRYTYGSDSCYPFSYGWTEVWASSESEANSKFREIHPDVHEGVLNCAFVYSDDELSQTMREKGNFGAKTREVLIAAV